MTIMNDAINDDYYSNDDSDNDNDNDNETGRGSPYRSCKIIWI